MIVHNVKFLPSPLVPIKVNKKPTFLAYSPNYCHSHLRMKAYMKNLRGLFLHPPTVYFGWHGCITHKQIRMMLLFVTWTVTR